MHEDETETGQEPPEDDPGAPLFWTSRRNSLFSTDIRAFSFFGGVTIAVDAFKGGKVSLALGKTTGGRGGQYIFDREIATEIAEALIRAVEVSGTTEASGNA